MRMNTIDSIDLPINQSIHLSSIEETYHMRADEHHIFLFKIVIGRKIKTQRR